MYSILNTTPADIKEFNYMQKDYLAWLNELATALGSVVKENVLSLSPEIGAGYSASFFIEEGCTACVNNFQLSEEYHFNRTPSDNFGVIIYLYHFQTLDRVHYKLEEHAAFLDIGSHFELRVTNSQTSQQLKFGKTTHVKGISIFLENEWISRNLSHRLTDVFNYLQKVNYFNQFVKIDTSNKIAIEPQFDYAELENEMLNKKVWVNKNELVYFLENIPGLAQG